VGEGQGGGKSQTSNIGVPPTPSPTSAVSGVRVSVFKDLGSKFGTTFGARREALGAVRGGV